MNIIDWLIRHGLTPWPVQELLLRLVFHLPLDHSQENTLTEWLQNGQQQATHDFRAESYGHYFEEARYARAWACEQPHGRPITQGHWIGDAGIFDTIVLVLGRRGGLTTLLAMIQTYLTNVYMHTPLVPITVLADVHKVAQFRQPQVQRAVGSVLDVQAFQQQRGQTVPYVGMDDPCHWEDDAGPMREAEILTLPTRTSQWLDGIVAQHPRLLLATNPTVLDSEAGGRAWLARQGGMKRTLVVQLATWNMNPRLPSRQHCQTAYLPPSMAYQDYTFESEFGAQWLDDILADRLHERIYGRMMT